MSRVKALVAISFFLLVFATLWLRSPEDMAEALSASDRATPSRVSTPARKARPLSLAEPEQAPAASPTRADLALSTETEDPLAVYLAQSIYPPTSRPLRIEQEDLIHPNRPYDSRRLATSDPSVMFLLTADRFFVTGEEEVTVTLEASRGAAAREVRIDQAEAFVEGAMGEPAAEPVAIAFSPEGLGYASRFSPGRLVAADRAVFFTVRVTFSDVDSMVETASLRFQLTPEAALPARFSGRFDEAIQGGSLMIHAGIDVVKAGLYAIDANLWDATGKPVAWARFKGALTGEDTSVPLRFFGKAIRDAEPSLPLRLGELRGARLAEGEDPDLEAIPASEVTYETSLTSLAGLSDEPWDSPKKRAMIRMLRAAEQDPGAPRLFAVSLR